MVDRIEIDLSRRSLNISSKYRQSTMGCTASKIVTVENVEASETRPVSKKSNIDDIVDRTYSIPKSPTEIPPIESEEPPTDMLETPVVSNMQKKVTGLSFELAFEDDAEESIIKKHPPKRFQSMENRSMSPFTIDKLQEKLEEAEMRRQQILSHRVQSSKQRNHAKKQMSESDVYTGEDDNSPNSTDEK